MPAAAPAPARNAVGSDQNSGAQEMVPATAIDSAAMPTAVFVAVAAVMKPMAAMDAGMARCQRRYRR
jgi:hypothetical protein